MHILARIDAGAGRAFRIGVEDLPGDLVKQRCSPVVRCGVRRFGTGGGQHRHGGGGGRRTKKRAA